MGQAAQTVLDPWLRDRLAGYKIPREWRCVEELPRNTMGKVRKLAVREFVAHLNRERGVTVILTTHDMDDIEALCSRVVMIGGGKLLCDGSLEELRARVRPERCLVLDLENPKERVDDPDARVVAVNGRRVELRFDPGRVPATELISRITARHSVVDLIVEYPPIEEVIAQLYRTAGEAVA